MAMAASRRVHREEEEEKAYGASTHDEVVPEVVQSFVVYFYYHIREKNVYEVLSMYESSFNKISARFFKASPWPPVSAVSHLVDNDAVFCMLYNELYYRHIFSRLIPTLEQRLESWENYAQLLNVILRGNLNMQLPNQWLWEMVDEFTYQFQSFHQYRGKLSNKSEEELSTLRKCSGAWHVLSIFNYLQALVDRSGIEAILEGDRRGENSFTATEGYDYATSNVLRALGYFSLIGLLKVHTLMGDYEGALRSIEAIDVQKEGLYAKVPGANVTTLYYVGFCYLMMQRYTDAIRSFNKLLRYVSKGRSLAKSALAQEQVARTGEHALALLAVCLSVCPKEHLVDDSVLTSLREKHSDKMLKMAQGDTEAFDELFSTACPKFINPATPNYEDRSSNCNHDAYARQLRMFLSEVQSQHSLPLLRSYLRLYSSIRLPKLASLLEVDEESLRQQLLGLKHRAQALEHDGSLSPLAGDWVSISNLQFSLDGDVVSSVEAQPKKHLAHFFSQQARLFEQMADDARTGVDPTLTGSAS